MKGQSGGGNGAKTDSWEGKESKIGSEVGGRKERTAQVLQTGRGWFIREERKRGSQSKTRGKENQLYTISSYLLISWVYFFPMPWQNAFLDWFSTSQRAINALSRGNPSGQTFCHLYSLFILSKLGYRCVVMQLWAGIVSLVHSRKLQHPEHAARQKDSLSKKWTAHTLYFTVIMFVHFQTT